MNTEPTVEKLDEETIKPFELKNLFSLFFQPKKFFSQAPSYHHQSIILITYCIGIFLVMDRIDQSLLKDSSATGLMNTITNSWLFYWLWVLGFGMVSAAFAWLIQGWWYKKRLQWSGVKDADPQLARHVWALQSFVAAFPIILVTIFQTVLYSSYRDAYENSSILNLIALPFMFWSCWVSYRGATGVFPVNGWAKFWFFIGSMLFYLIAIGALFAVIMN